MTDLAAVILAAGEGRRLRPLTGIRTKALCPVGNIPLLDLALARLAALGLTGPDTVAVNACYLADQVVAHVGDRAHVSVEVGTPLGTAGGLGNLRQWIDGRPVLVGNADAYLAADPAADPAADRTVGPIADLAGLLDGWDGTSVRMLGVPAGTGREPEFGAYRFAGFSLLPWTDVLPLAPEPANLARTTWRPAERSGRLTVIEYAGRYLDTGTPADYLAANLDAAGSASLVADSATVTAPLHSAVIGAGATVAGPVTRAVVWPGGYVGPDEHLADAIRVGRDLTVTMNSPMGSAAAAGSPTISSND